MMPLALFALSGCLAVNAGSEHILAADLAPAYPEMAGLPPDTPIGFAPAPGVVRVFRAPELRMLAARFHLAAAPPRDICVTRPVAPLEPDGLLEAMRRTLPDARIELLDYSRQPAPRGQIEFPLTGFRTAQTGELWSGAVHFAGNRRFVIWARVKVSVHKLRVVAVTDLHPGKAIAAGEVKIVERDEPPGSDALAGSMEQAIGKWPRQSIPAGTAIRTAQLEPAKEVVRGDTVVVEVRNGAATLKLEATAEGSGAAGETIPVRNPASQKIFRARVEGKGLVSVNAGLISAPKVNP